MKNANLFSKQKYHTLTDTENKLIKKVVTKIAENHKDDDWIVIDAAIRARVNFDLARLLCDDLLDQGLEVERTQEENAEKESDDILNNIISEIKEGTEVKRYEDKT